MKRAHTILLMAILLFSFLSRIWRLDYPKEYVFDEVYHAVTAKLMANNDPRDFEWWNEPPEPNTAVDWLHPPLAKYTQAFFINTLGETSFAWRLSSVFFGVGVIALTYFLALATTKNNELALVAAFLASLDGLLLVQSRIAMNDIHVTFFIMLTLWLYWKEKIRYKQSLTFKSLLLVGISGGLAISSKWSGLFVILSISLFEFIECLKSWLSELFNKSFQFDKDIIIRISSDIFTRAITLLFLPIVVYVLSYWLMFIQGKSLFCNLDYPQQSTCYQEQLKIGDFVWYDGLVSHFVELHHQIWWYQTHLEATHPYQSRPWQWITNTRPVWYFVNHPTKNSVENIYAMGNIIIFWGGLSIVVVLLISIFGRKTKHSEKKYLSFLLLNYFIVWLPWQFSPRIMFFYHYTPAIPLLCILIAYWIIKIYGIRVKLFNQNIPIGKVVAIGFVSAAYIFFLVWYPHWTALPVPNSWAEKIYFLHPFWK